MKELFRMVFVLTAVSLVAGVLLAVTQKYTAEPIRQTERAQLFESLNAVLPVTNATPQILEIPAAGGGTNTFYFVRRDQALAGIAFQCSSANGYGGPVEVLVGLTPEGTIHKLKVVKHTETPGLGSRIGDDAFLRQFTNKPLDGVSWKVRKDGGPVDAVSGATISSRALCDALSNGLTLYSKNKDAIVAAAAAPAPAPAP